MMKNSVEREPCGVAIRLGHMGDVVLTSGVLSFFGELWGKPFDVVTRAPWVSLFDNHPYVRRVIGANAEELHGRALLGFLTTLAKSYTKDVPLYDLHGVLRSRLLRMFWRGKVHTYDKRGLERRLFMASHGRMCVTQLREKTVLERYATAFSAEVPSEPLLLPKLYVTDSEREYARKLLRRSLTQTDNVAGKVTKRASMNSAMDVSVAPHFAGVSQNTATLTVENTSPLIDGIGTMADNRQAGTPQYEGMLPKIVAIHPFATHSNKTWSLDKWKSVTTSLSSLGIPWIVLGAASAEQAAFWEGNNSFVNTTSLRETMALLAESAVLLTGDSGPMHLARGVGTSVVAFFGPTVREWGFYPTKGEGIILESARDCRPCSLHGAKPCPYNGACLEDIATEHALTAITRLLE